MYELNEDYLRQRIRDLQEEYKQYVIQHQRMAAKKRTLTSRLKKLKSHITGSSGNRQGSNQKQPLSATVRRHS